MTSAAQIIAAIAPNPNDWVGLTLASGFTQTSGAHVVAARQIGDEVELCGRANATITSGITALTLPAAFTPSVGAEVQAVGAGGCGVLIIASSGAITVFPFAGTMTSISFDNVRFRLV